MGQRWQVPELLFRRVVRHCWRLYGRPTSGQIDATGVRRITELVDSAGPLRARDSTDRQGPRR
ncbi:hypothetical protein AB0F73_15735 [Micromonospora purpureochromogenes]|uniref:hypothetical protein n=1 Tax=Micromonospora purpureochromogenes TaxID=47872 RepID=UPI0033EC02D6